MENRNRYKGKCRICKKTVEAGHGFFEKGVTGWKVKHATGTVDEMNRCKKSEAYLAYKNKQVTCG